MEPTPNPLESPDQPKIGVYICRCGGNISDYLDTEKLADTVRGIPGVTLSKVDTFMCSDPGQDRIVQDVQAGLVNRVVVASCSPFLHEVTFKAAVRRGGLNPYLYTHVNIREQGSWAHGHQGDAATQHALHMIAGGVGKVRHLQPLDKIRLPSHRRVLVIGGGVAGMKAALDTARRGLPVLLVEKAPQLGGRSLDLGRVYPSEQEARELVKRLEKDVRAEEKITVLTGSEVTAIGGFIGNFEATISTGSEQRTDAIGAVIMATGFTPYQPPEGEYAFGHSQVVTLPEFVKALRDMPSGKTLTWNGKPVRSVGLMHCVGSRQCEGCFQPQPDGQLNDYCSRVCCTSLLRNAVELRSRFPETQIYDFHQDIRTYGRGQEDYYTCASDQGVTFFRWKGEEPPVVTARDKGGLAITVKDQLTFGEEIEVPVDLLVLGVGMMPGPIADLVDQLKLPVGADRFLQEVHPKLRPVEVAVAGVLLAGTAQGPMSIEESLEGASAAAAKASILLAHDYTDLEPFVALVTPDLCVGCNACVEECQYAGAVTMEAGPEGKSVATVNPGLCKGCGACVAVCPTRAIDVQGWTLDQFDAMIDGMTDEALRVPATQG
ncbi:MAG: CoB--CoM heterodisulfide reductase iron-sulfur subunit A family protein [Verrucomicrobia bacterium]|nr:CoB--CoM heterodisulfide reductase iron-sulfur subunit A family protein [Kiritimatiellia bacterium]MCB1101354.1 CoB--CoM heterodisulfide reductase iron-sulfur subunit A family protein [Kiritimatiellia bacterium]MCP5487097.1 CoB--CoM heterodisulfide reductase iron-sulfur subunit A family protein [Verrucomicrobiota bacterium]